MRRTTWMSMALGLTCLSLPLFGQSVGPRAMPPFLGKSLASPPPLGLAKGAGVTPLAVLPLAAEGARDQLAALLAWNQAGRTPAQNGFVRPLPDPQTVRFAADAANAGDPGNPANAADGPWAGGRLVRRTSGEVAWGARVEVQGAYRLRLHLKDVRLPVGTRLWVYGDRESLGPFGPDLIGPDGSLWLPGISGATASLEVVLPAPAPAAAPAGPYGFTLDDLLEIVPTADDPVLPFASASCLVDSRCVAPSTFDAIDTLRAGVASLDFVVGGSSFVCTGSLLNDKGSTGTPYLLTANHCISTADVAATLDAVWDFVDTICFGTFPDRSSLPRSVGATLLATSLQSDFAFLRLASVPPGRTFLGWNAGPTAVAQGTVLHRLSYPVPNGFIYPQTYSQSTATFGIRSCSDPTGRPINDTTKFLHSVSSVGAPFGGSSGSPAILSGGYVVGQLLGVCPGITEACLLAGQFDQLDGAFSATYSSISSWLGGTQSGGCTPDATTACLLNGRFKATVRFRGAFDNAPADTSAFAKSVSGFASPSFETSFFYFNNPNNIEVLLKMLDQGNTNSQGQPTIAVLFGTASPLRIEVAITDTSNGTVRTYTSQFNSGKGTSDFTAFVK